MASQTLASAALVGAVLTGYGTARLPSGPSEVFGAGVALLVVAAGLRLYERIRSRLPHDAPP
jgi:lysozyme family protein